MKPLDLWRIYLNCRERGEVLPEHVLEYLDAVADSLVRRGWGNVPEDNEKFAAEALGLAVGRGKRSIFRQDQLDRRNRMVKHWWQAYKAGHLDTEKTQWISELFEKSDPRDLMDDRDFYSWASSLLGVDANTIEKIVSSE